MFMSEQNGGVIPPLRAALGVDVGTTNTKVVLVALDARDDAGVPVAHELRRHSIPTPASGAALLDAVLTGISAVTGGGDERIEAVGIASMAETGTMLDRAGTPLGDLLRWNSVDDGAVDDAVASVGASALHHATGVPVPGKTPVAHWLRLSRDGDGRLADSTRWCGVADLIALELTGRLTTHHTLAARTMAYRSAPLGDPLPTAFDPDLLAIGGFTLDRMPTVLEPGAPSGTLTAEAASRTGLTAGTPVFIAGHDHAVGAWAAGVREHGDAADSVGTAEALFRVSGTAIPRDAAHRAGMSVARTVDGMHESLLAGNPTAGALVDWAFRSLFPGADRPSTLASASRAAANWTGEPLVLPYLRGRQAPQPDQHAVFRVLGRSGEEQTLPADPGAALTAVLGGLVLHLAWLDQAQDAVIGSTRDRGTPLRVLGGPGAADDAWWALKTALIPGGVARVASAEPVASGAALLAARSITGESPVIPCAPDSSPDPASIPPLDETGAAALLADFVSAATGQQKPQ